MPLTTILKGTTLAEATSPGAHLSHVLIDNPQGVLQPITTPAQAQVLLDALTLLATHLPIDTRLLGYRGELLAFCHFSRLGYRVTWQSHQADDSSFDLLIENATERALVEVKYRSQGKSRTINMHKLDHLATAMAEFHADRIILFLVNGNGKTYTMSYIPET